MNNIELKIGIDDFGQIKKLLRKIGAKEEGLLVQKDIYYYSKNNILKMREINGEEFVLIGYSRSGRKAKRVSDYDLLNLDKEQAKTLKKILKDSFGEKVVVKKKRNLWIYKNTRIHLDTVDSLGKFLELETVVKESINKAKKEYKEANDLLRLGGYKKFEQSYSDLMYE